jgi:hypothetical protein
MAEITGKYSFMIPWQFLGLYSTSGLYKAPPPPPGGDLSFRARHNTRRIRVRLSNIVD